MIRQLPALVAGTPLDRMKAQVREFMRRARHHQARARELSHQADRLLDEIEEAERGEAARGPPRPGSQGR